MEAKPQIFISYAREDLEKVLPLYEGLSAAGFRPWMDQYEIAPGELWEFAIERAIRSSDFFLACLSWNSASKRGILQREIRNALDAWKERLEGDIYLIPIRLEDCEVPEELRRFQWVDLFEKNGWSQLLRAIRVGMGRLEDQEARLLEGCTTVAAIADAHHSLAVSDLEDPVNSLLRSFSRLSQDVDAALHQESAYNQRLVLSAVEDRLDSLLRELTRSRERYAFRFRPIAANWRQIVADKARELSATAEQRQEIDSPYIIGVPLTEQQEIFVGRTDVSAYIEQLLLDRRRPPLLLYGQRRMGKTSLLNNLGRLLPSTIVPLFVDLQGPASHASDHAGFLYNLAREMIRSADRQRGLTLPALARESLADDPFTRFDEWLDEVELALETNAALFMLDEFESLDSALAEGRFNETAVLGMLRHLIQHRPHFKVMLAGSHTLDEVHRWASYLINVQVIKLGYLKESEAMQLIEHPTEDFALRYEPDASRRVLDVTRGHPYLVQLLCAEIVAFKNEQPPSARRLARLTDVEAAIPEALSHGSLFFADIERNQVDADGLSVLRLMAASGEGAVISQQDLARNFTGVLERTLDLLMRRDLIESVNGGYQFQVEMIRRWFAPTDSVITDNVNNAINSVKSWLRRAIP
jgi:hypothetical protein